MPTPAQLGYRLPAEWEPHQATWLSWPHNRQSWPEKFGPIPEIWRELVQLLCEGEDVEILAGGRSVMAQAQAMVGHLPGVRLHQIPTNDAWIRDSGPIFLVSPRQAHLAVVDWGYNAWGGKYPPYDLDNAIPHRIADRLGLSRFDPGVVLEGGSFDTNGQGVVLTTEPCLLNPNRNGHLSREQIEAYFADYLAAELVIWLPAGILGDDTDGHVDTVARFVSDSTVVAVVEDDPADENYKSLLENMTALQAARDQHGRALQVIPLPMPGPLFHQGQRLPASYANFYIANTCVIVPTFGDPADSIAVETLRACFPHRRVVGVPATDLVWGLGTFHCITQQQPALTPS